MAAKKSTTRPKPKHLAKTNWPFPCSLDLEIRIPPNIQVLAHPIDANNRTEQRLEVPNEHGVIICVQSADRANPKHIIPFIETNVDPPVVALFEVDDTFPTTENVPSPCRATTRKKRR